MEKMTKKTSESEGNKRYYASIAHEFMKGKRIKLTPNEKCLLGLIVYRSQHEGGIHFANQTICDVFGWDPKQLYRTCNGLVAKGVIARDTSKAMYGKKGTEYTLLLSRDETDQQPPEAPEQQVQYQPILLPTVAEPPHVKPFHEQVTQNDNEVVELLKQQNELLKQQNELLKRQLEALDKQMELLANALNSRIRPSVSPSNSSDEQLPTKEEIIDSTPTPHAHLDQSDDEPPTPTEPFGEQSDYLMAVTAAEEGGTIGGLATVEVEPDERGRLLQEARLRVKKAMSNWEAKGLKPRDAALKAREVVEDEYGPKLGNDGTFSNMLLNLNLYAMGADKELII